MAIKPTEFVPVINIPVDGKLPLRLYPKLTLPVSRLTGKSMDESPMPEFVASRVLIELSDRENFLTKGFAQANFSYRFEDFKSQWLFTPPPHKGDVGWHQFQGGKVFLEITPRIYIDRDFSDMNGDFFALFMNHELLHVQDDIDLINEMPDLLKASKFFKEALIDDGTGSKEPAKLAEGIFNGWFGPGVEVTEVVDEIEWHNGFEQVLLELWGTNRNKYDDARDDPAEYRKLSDEYYRLAREKRLAEEKAAKKAKGKPAPKVR